MTYSYYSKRGSKNQPGEAAHPHAPTHYQAPSTGREEDCGARVGGGLSTAHISPQGENLSHVQIWNGGSLIRAVRARQGEKGKHVYGKRGKASFSGASRLRLMRFLAKFKRSLIPVFVTLTYPGEYTNNSKEWKRHLDRWAKRFLRRFPGAWFVWRLEFQKRGAPHYHLLVYGADYQELLGWVSHSWYTVVGSGDYKHLAAGTRVEKLRSLKGAMAYASKYLGKKDQMTYEGVGRWWGVVGRSNIQWAQLVVAAVTDRDVIELIRYMKRFMRLKGKAARRAYYSLTAICDAEFWLLKLDFLWREGQFIGTI